MLENIFQVVPKNMLLDTVFILLTFLSIICIVHTGAAIGKLKTTPHFTIQDVTAKFTSYLVRYGVVYILTVIVFMQILIRLVKELVIIFG